MRKNGLLILLTLLVGITAAMTALSQEDIEFVDDSGFESRMRPPARFVHDEHNDMAELDCGVCHHYYDEDGKLLEDETSEDQECSECHLKAGDNPKFVLSKVYHQRCKGCHEEQKQGPVLCAECHVK